MNGTTSNNRLNEIIDSILRPLKFASKDSFQHLHSIKSVEPLMMRLTEEARSLDIPTHIKNRFLDLKEVFAGFDALASDEKKERILFALDAASNILRPEAKKRGLTAHEAAVRLKGLKTPLQYVKGIGPKLAERLAKKGLSTVEDMIYFLPIRYEDRSRIKKIRELTPGVNEVVVGTVMATGEVRYGRRKVFEMAVSDPTGILKVKWFNYKNSYMRVRFKNGSRLKLYGTVSAFGGFKEMIHPDIEPYDEGDENDTAQAEGMVPVYSQIENFHQKTLRKLVRGVVEKYADLSVGGVPFEVRARLGLLDVSDAFIEAHKASASNSVDATLAKRSLVFDELFLLELGLGLKKESAKKEGGISFNAAAGDACLAGKLRKLLPFKLTRAQEKVLEEIRGDMAEPHPMNRLIQGDVGSGKTIVSFISALWAIKSGYQAAIMAPTEILSEQHYINIHKYAESLGIRATLLKGSMTASEKKKALEAVRTGEANLVIGTHSLIQKDVEFARLGLIIIDEQHRFGVVQRAALKKKAFGSDSGVSPDFLIMTATPIPRTLSMTVFGDLDVSIIDELPPGRHPVATKILREKDRPLAYATIKRELNSGSQCYIVYPLVEESEELSLKDATNMKVHLEKDVFPEFRVGLMHGRLKSDEKESVMRDFKDKKLDILVSTTVIEVGVDVPNATVMLIEHAERFGLSQLHQLRGRVGRGEKKSICLLLAQWTQSEDTFKRLKVMEETMDGFKIAEEDLKIRGPGDFLGTRQAGMPDFRTAEALGDMKLLKCARDEAFKYLARHPGLAEGESALVKEALKSRWEGRLELAEIG